MVNYANYIFETVKGHFSMEIWGSSAGQSNLHMVVKLLLILHNLSALPVTAEASKTAAFEIVCIYMLYSFSGFSTELQVCGLLMK